MQVSLKRKKKGKETQKHGTTESFRASGIKNLLSRIRNKQEKKNKNKNERPFFFLSTRPPTIRNSQEIERQSNCCWPLGPVQLQSRRQKLIGVVYYTIRNGMGLGVVEVDQSPNNKITFLFFLLHYLYCKRVLLHPRETSPLHTYIVRCYRV